MAVAIDCDHPDPEVLKLGALHMSSARSLPFVMYSDADGQFLHGTSGSRSVADFLADLNRVAAGGM